MKIGNFYVDDDLYGEFCADAHKFHIQFTIKNYLKWLEDENKRLKEEKKNA